VPILAILGTEPDPLGWGTPPDDVRSHLPPSGRLVIVEGAGHFIHIERPHEVAELVLEHLADLAAPVGGP
jgi:pimeloyl-ACP methyl ester carboxylesterase